MKRKIVVIFSVSLFILFLFAIFINCFIAPKKYTNHVVAYSDKYGLDKAFVYAVIKVESDFKKDAVSKSGALGLMQILPKTAMWIADELGEDYVQEKLFNPEVNIRYGCFYLRYLFEKFNDLEIVICAYNAGEGKVFDWVDNGVINKDKIDYDETRKYLKKVEKYCRIYKNKIINV